MEREASCCRDNFLPDPNSNTIGGAGGREGPEGRGKLFSFSLARSTEELFLGGGGGGGIGRGAWDFFRKKQSVLRYCSL